jgi:hypothetical protein
MAAPTAFGTAKKLFSALFGVALIAVVFLTFAYLSRTDAVMFGGVAAAASEARRPGLVKYT